MERLLLFIGISKSIFSTQYAQIPVQSIVRTGNGDNIVQPKGPVCPMTISNVGHNVTKASIISPLLRNIEHMVSLYLEKAV